MAVLLFGHKVKKSVGSKVPNLGGKGYKKSVAGDDNGASCGLVWGLYVMWRWSGTGKEPRHVPRSIPTDART